VTEASPSPRAFFRGVRPATLAGGLVFVAGAVAGVAVHPAFLLLAALGAFGPALLRETGLLRDQDEFQRQAAASAAGHGYLAGGLFVTAVLVARGWSRGMAPDPEAGTWLMALSVMLAARFLSYAARFWDARKAAFRILVGFGTFWLLFVVLSHGSEPLSLAMEALVVPVPFFALAFLSRRFPRASGAILLALVAGGAWFFGVFRHRPDGRYPAVLPVVLFLLLPLAFVAIALLRIRRDDEA
jgi:hypothetical protein